MHKTNFKDTDSVNGVNVRLFICEGTFKLKANKSTPDTLSLFFPSLLQYQFGEDLEASLLRPLEASLLEITNSYCGRTSYLFTKRLEQSIWSVQREGPQGRRPRVPP